MPLYRVGRHEGDAVTVQALRVSAGDEEYTFEVPRADGLWQTSYRVPVAEVQAISRRVTELNGSVRWVAEKRIHRE